MLGLAGPEDKKRTASQSLSSLTPLNFDGHGLSFTCQLACLGLKRLWRHTRRKPPQRNVG